MEKGTYLLPPHNSAADLARASESSRARGPSSALSGLWGHCQRPAARRLKDGQWAAASASSWGGRRKASLGWAQSRTVTIPPHSLAAWDARTRDESHSWKALRPFLPSTKTAVTKRGPRLPTTVGPGRGAGSVLLGSFHPQHWKGWKEMDSSGNCCLAAKMKT